LQNAGNFASHRRLRGFAALDAEFAGAIASRYERRHHMIEMLLRRLNLASTAPQVLEARVQLVMALTGFEFYDVLAGERGAREVAPLVLKIVMSALNIEEQRSPSG